MSNLKRSAVVIALVVAAALIFVFGACFLRRWRRDGMQDAVVNGDIASLRELVSKGYDPNMELVGGHTPLTKACLYDRMVVVRYLLRSGADPNSCWDGRSALYTGMLHGGTDMALLLLENGADPNWACERNYYIPIVMAAYFAKEELVEELIRRSANVNVSNGDPGTPLHAAASAGSLELTRRFLDLGLSPDRVNGHDQTPLAMAAHRGQIEVVKLLLDVRDHTKPLSDKVWEEANYRASVSGDDTIVQLLQAYSQRRTAER